MAVFHLGHVQLVAIALLAFGVAEKRQQTGHPGFDGPDDVGGREGIGQLLQALGLGAGDQQVVALLEGNAFVAQAAGQPVVAVEPDADVTDSCAKNLTFQPRKDKPAAAKND
jgi:hypothetical protein